METVLRNGPWSFDRNLVILLKISSDEHPSDLDLFRVSFWVRIYNFSLKFRSEAIAKKLGGVIGVFEELGLKDQHRIGKFLRIKVSLDLKKPLKRGTNVKFQGRDLWVSFKYERLPNFYFICRRIGHQMKECVDVEDSDEGDYSELEEKDQAYGPWLRASPLPRIIEEIKRETSSGTCNKFLFSPANTSKGDSVEERRSNEEEVRQVNEVDLSHVGVVANVAPIPKPTPKNVEEVAESLGTVTISKQLHPGETSNPKPTTKIRKWTRQKAPSAPRKPKQGPKAKGSGKRSMVEVMATEYTLAEMMTIDKKFKGGVVMKGTDDKTPHSQ